MTVQESNQRNSENGAFYWAFDISRNSVKWIKRAERYSRINRLERHKNAIC